MSRKLLSTVSITRLLPTFNMTGGRLLQPVGQWLQQHWFRLLILGILTLVLLRKDVTLQLNLSNTPVLFSSPTETIQATTVSNRLPASQNNLATTPDSRKNAYVERFAQVAREEMKKFGIPASIKLAQALLETQAGASPLAVKANNHFGIKCFSRSCEKGHCTNFSDDSHKDFFRCYDSAWESYRAHSLLLRKGDRYQHLFELPATDYRAWAEGLGKSGYATDQRYAQKLVRLIEDMKLQQYDS